MENGYFNTIACVNSNPELVYSHGSDGNLDLLIARVGNSYETLSLGIKYLEGKEKNSSLMTIKKIKKLILISEYNPAINLDGELLPITKISTYEVCPHLLVVYGEY